MRVSIITGCLSLLEAFREWVDRHKATKVVRKEGRSPLIFQFHCAAPTVPPLCKRLELAFFRGGGVLQYFRLNLLVRKQGVSIDRGTGC